MCLLVVKPAGKELPEEYIKAAWQRNKDGGGFACWSKEDGLDLSKGYTDVDLFTKDIKAQESKLMIVHFRWATHGTKDAKNTHPFLAGGGWVMAHNGVFSQVETQKDESDTAAFVRIYIKPVLKRDPRAIIDNHDWKKALNVAATGSKLAFLNTEGETVIVHEDHGDWVDGVWYSNSSYGPWKPAPVSTYQSEWYGSGNGHYVRPPWWADADAYSYGKMVIDLNGNRVWERNPVTKDQHMAMRGWIPGKRTQWERQPKLPPALPASTPLDDSLESVTWPFQAAPDMTCDCCEKPMGTEQAWWVGGEYQGAVCNGCKELLLLEEKEANEADAAEALEESAYAQNEKAEVPDNEISSCIAGDDGPHYIGHEDEDEPEYPDPHDHGKVWGLEL